MLVATLIMTGFAFLLLGIIIGNLYGGKKVKRAPKHSIQNRAVISADYKNFYDYDGSEQI